MIRYIIEKVIDTGYGHGIQTLMDGDRPRTFTSRDAAIQWLIDNDREFTMIPIIMLHDWYNIKPYIV